MRVTKGQLRQIIKEALLREASIEVDWVGDVQELQTIPQSLSYEVIDPSGPGGGAAVVVVTGEREALKDWYVYDYNAGDQFGDAEFEEFVRE